jgi:molecular chaperone GrpE (heat shock protein)
VTSELDSAEDTKATAAMTEAGNPQLPGIGELPDPALDAPDDLIAEVSAAVGRLANSAERYHERAAQRESVIDYLRSELETLRRGERRGMLRPLLTDMCRLRNDLLRQAATLPADYDAEMAVKLLLSYAETVQLALESNGVDSYAPDEGDAFDARRHRRVMGAETSDPGQVGRIARVLRDGYLDIEANSPIAQAEVSVFVAVKEAQ